MRVATVSTRISRMSYGMDLVEVFDQAKHLETDKQFWSSLGLHMAVNQVDWYLRKVSHDKEIFVAGPDPGAERRDRRNRIETPVEATRERAS